MELVESKDTERNITISIIFNEFEIIDIDLNSWDRKLIEKAFEAGSIADKLIALEIIARKIEDSKKPIDNKEEYIGWKE